MATYFEIIVNDATAEPEAQWAKLKHAIATGLAENAGPFKADTPPHFVVREIEQCLESNFRLEQNRVVPKAKHGEVHAIHGHPTASGPIPGPAHTSLIAKRINQFLNTDSDYTSQQPQREYAGIGRLFPKDSVKQIVNTADMKMQADAQTKVKAAAALSTALNDTTALLDKRSELLNSPSSNDSDKRPAAIKELNSINEGISCGGMKKVDPDTEVAKLYSVLQEVKKAAHEHHTTSSLRSKVPILGHSAKFLGTSHLEQDVDKIMATLEKAYGGKDNIPKPSTTKLDEGTTPSQPKEKQDVHRSPSPGGKQAG